MSADGTLTMEQAGQLVVHIHNGDSEAIADLLTDAEAHPVFVLHFLAGVIGPVARIIAEVPEGAAAFAIPRAAEGARVPQWLQLVAAATNEDEPMIRAHVRSIVEGPDHACQTALVQIMGMLRAMLRHLAERGEQ